jgi:sarcosine oxidase, subunit gamma
MPERATLRVSGIEGRAVWRVKSWAPEHAVGDQSVMLAGQRLPVPVGTTSSEQFHALCVGPTEWLIVQHVRHAPHAAADGLAVVDLSDGIVALDVRGPAVREVLSAGCGLDLHPQRFPPGRCARTRLGHVAVVVECLNEHCFELYVARSQARYLSGWLADAAAGCV